MPCDGRAATMPYRAGAVAMTYRVPAGSARRERGHDAGQQSRQNERDNDDRQGDPLPHHSPCIGRRHAGLSNLLGGGRKC